MHTAYNYIPTYMYVTELSHQHCRNIALPASMTLLDVTLYCVILIQTSLTGLLVDAQDVEEIDAFVTEVMRCANIPGLTLGVVNNGEVNLFILFIWGFTSLSTLYRSYHDR